MKHIFAAIFPSSIYIYPLMIFLHSKGLLGIQTIDLFSLWLLLFLLCFTNLFYPKIRKILFMF